MSLSRWLNKSIGRNSFAPLRFPTSGFKVYGDDVYLEEEYLEEFDKGLYYPMQLGEVLATRYQVVGKLGFGTTSTVWLARDMQVKRHVALKVYTRDRSHDEEFDIYKTISQRISSHPGQHYVASALDTFTVQKAGYDHRCLVQRPMWDSFTELLDRHPSHRFTKELLQAGLRQLFLALDFLHTECKIVHTDISGNNILQEIEDTSILDQFVDMQIKQPCPRKFVERVTIYGSRRFGLPKKFGRPVLSDFGSAVRADQERNNDAQPDVYRSPEVMLGINWSYPIDIWNVGLVAWTLFQGRHLFYGIDPIKNRYLTRAHLAEVIGMLGPPPKDLLRRGRRTPEFFDTDGNFIADVPVTKSTLEQAESRLQGHDQEQFLCFMRRMLQWRPEDRSTAGDLLVDPWLNNPS